jgi:enamine deaminase RidA (YjgF/YER057c/UK114 family)
MSNIVADVAMSHRIVNPPELGEPRGFSHAVVAGDTVYLAGQIGAGRTMLDQFDAAIGNLLTALGASGGQPRDLVSLQVFVTDVAGYQAVLPGLGRTWRKRFGDHYPAMGLFGVSGLFDLEAMVEVMGVAVLQTSQQRTTEDAGRRP